MDGSGSEDIFVQSWCDAGGMTVIGIDPGLSGALACLDENDRLISIPMPVMDGFIDGGAVARWLGERDPNLVVIELQQSMPAEWTDRRTGKLRKQGVASAFKLGRNYGQLLGILQAGAYPYHIVAPQTWKGAMHLGRDKEQSRRRAIELLPKSGDQFSLKKDEARAEAALIAWWYLHERNRKAIDKELMSQL